jgi:hypothetical protein
MVTLSFLSAPEHVKAEAVRRLLYAGALAKEIAPYAISITRLYLTFIGALARGFMGPRASCYIDLQYLFYAPFGMVFASNDRFHRDLWGATSGRNSFAWGADLKADLSARVAIRKNPDDASERFPVELPGSIINQLWKRYIKHYPTPAETLRKPETIDDLEPDVRDAILRAGKVFDEMAEC